MKTAKRILAAVLLAIALAAAGESAQANAVTGVLSGHVITDSGEPAANVNVFAQIPGKPSHFGRTGADGSYRFSDIEPGQYNVQFSPRDGMKQYAHGKGFGSQADMFEVKAGEETVVDETLLPRGNIVGRFVDFDGSPLGHAIVTLSGRDGEWFVFTQADANGEWHVDGAYAGRYQINFSVSDTIQQAAFGKVGKAQPDLVAVAAHTTTRVDDTAIARASLRITATDARTGAPVMSFNGGAGPKSGTTESGELILDAVQIGTHDVSVFADGYFPSDTELTLTGDGQQHLAVVLEPQSIITVKVVDAATGAPVRGFCVGAFNRAAAYVSDALCGNPSDEEGNVRIDFLHAGTYQLLATPGWDSQPGYGAQWVGAHGGTGQQLLGKSFTVALGQTLTGPVVKLDRAGSISGRVSTADGQVPGFGSVGLMTGHPISGTGLGVPINEDGTYTIDFLGPYDWPLLFQAQNQASQWSGHVGDRLFARTVKVTAGVTASFDFRFRAATNVKLTGLSPEAQVLVYNAVTGDIMGATYAGGTTEAIEQMAGPQLIRLQVWPFGAGDTYWVGGSDFFHASTFWIPASGSKTIDASR